MWIFPPERFLLLGTIIVGFVSSQSELIADKAVTCTSRTMDVRFLFTRPFSGGIFTEKGFSNPRCKWAGDSKSEITVQVPINDTECGVIAKEESGEYSVKLIISPIDGLIVDGFSTINVRCIYSTQEITLTLPAGEHGNHSLRINGATSEGAIVTGSGGTPLLSMQILDGHGITGGTVAKAAVGQRITLDILLKDTSIYDFYVHSCFAHDGSNTPDASIQIVDVNGCGVRLSRAIDVPLLTSSSPDGGPKHIYLHMYGFQFTSSQFVHFECQVRPCVHSCKRQQCESPTSQVPLIPAARRRRESTGNSVEKKEDADSEAMGSLKLQTVLQIEPQQMRKAALVSSEYSNPGCVTVHTIVFVSLLLFALSIASSIFLFYICRPSKKRKEECGDNISESAYSVTTVYSD